MGRRKKRKKKKDKCKDKAQRQQTPEQEIAQRLSKSKMNLDTVIYGLGILGAFGLAAFGILFFTSHRTATIWVGFSTIVVFALAFSLRWQQQVWEGEEEKEPFSVAIETAWIGETRDATQVFTQYNPNMLSPVPVILFLRLVNLREVPSTISQLKIEVELKRAKWLFPSTWIQTTYIPDYMPLIWVNPPPTPPRQMQLLGPRLRTVLERRVLEPHETLRGWVLLDVPTAYNSAPHPLVFRITIRDTAGKMLVWTGPGPRGDENIGPERGFDIQDETDIRGFLIKHLADGQMTQ